MLGDADENSVAGDAADAHLDIHDVTDARMTSGNLHRSDDGDVPALLEQVVRVKNNFSCIRSNSLV